jgi:hypothetical protein
MPNDTRPGGISNVDDQNHSGVGSQNPKSRKQSDILTGYRNTRYHWGAQGEHLQRYNRRRAVGNASSVPLRLASSTRLDDERTTGVSKSSQTKPRRPRPLAEKLAIREAEKSGHLRSYGYPRSGNSDVGGSERDIETNFCFRQAISPHLTTVMQQDDSTSHGLDISGNDTCQTSIDSHTNHFDLATPHRSLAGSPEETPPNRNHGDSTCQSCFTLLVDLSRTCFRCGGDAEGSQSQDLLAPWGDGE